MAMMNGADPLSEDAGGMPATAASKRPGGRPNFRDVKSFDEQQPMGTTYGNPEVESGARPPTEKDDWDLPEAEVLKLQMIMPGAIQQIQT